MRLPVLRLLREFQNTNPERGRKRTAIRRRRSCMKYISKHEPRKGTETRGSVWISRLRRRFISKHEPRKGTETFSLPIRSRTLPAHFKTRTPKGDGNLWNRIVERTLTLFISKHEPRKGTETSLNFPIFYHLMIISKHEPRKGTETRRIFAFRARVSNFKTRTPKGDGNALSSRNGRRAVQGISKHEPRKGTETSL